MDSLLEYCFLKACKMTIKSSDLPMLSSNFFKNHLLAACPPGKNVDVKKSRYKKLSVFLAEMKVKGIINTSIMKGVETLLSIKVMLNLYNAFFKIKKTDFQIILSSYFLEKKIMLKKCFIVLKV